MNAGLRKLGVLLIWLLWGSCDSDWLSLGSVLPVGEPKLEPWEVTVKDIGPSSDKVLSLHQEPDGPLWLGTADRGVSRFDAKGTGTRGAWQNFGAETKLAGNAIQAFLRDRQGTLWIGTANGLLRYRPTDKEKWRTFRRNKSPSRQEGDDQLVSDNITALFQEKKGTLWIGTSTGGVCRNRNPQAERLGCEPFGVETLGDGSVISIIEGPDEEIWFATSKGVVRFNSNQNNWSPLDLPAELAGARPDALFRDRSERIWIATTQGLCRYDPGPKRFYVFLPANEIRTLFRDKSDGIWIGTARSGIFRHTNELGWRRPAVAAASVGKENLVSGKELIRYGIATSFEEAEGGGLWIGTNKGLLWYGPEGSNPIHSVKEEQVYGLVDDRAGLLWMIQNNDLVQLSANALKEGKDPSPRAWTIPGAQPVNVMRRIQHDELWLGTERGLQRFSMTKKRWIDGAKDRVLQKLIGVPIKNLQVDPVARDVVWISTDVGLFHYDASAGRRSRGHTQEENQAVALGNEKGPQRVLGVSWDGDGGTLALTDYGIYYRRAKDEKFGELQVDMPILDPRTIHSDEARGMLVGGVNGLAEFDRTTKRFGSIFSTQAIQSIAEDRHSVMWFGSRDPNQGVLLYEQTGEKWSWQRWLAQPGGLSSHIVNAILLDKNPGMWLATDRGVNHCAFDPQKLGACQVFMAPDSLQTRLEQGDVRLLPMGNRSSIWLAFPRYGVAQYQSQSGRFMRYTAEAEGGLPSSEVSAVYQRDNSTIWFATADRGVARYDVATKNWHSYGVKNGLAHGAVVAMSEDEHGVLWAATQRGLCLFNPKGDFWTLARNASKSAILDLEAQRLELQGIYKADSDGLWVVGRKGELFLFGSNPDGTFDAHRQPVEPVLASAAEPSGALWITNGSRLQRCTRKKSCEAVLESLPLGIDWRITQLTLSPKQDLWILAKEDAGRCSVYRLPGAAAQADPMKIRTERMARADPLFCPGDARGGTIIDDTDMLWVSSGASLSRRFLGLDGPEIGSFTTLPYAESRKVLLSQSMLVRSVPPSSLAVSTVSQAPPAPPPPGTLYKLPFGTVITSLARAPNNQIWIGTLLSGLILTDASLTKRQSISRTENLPSATVTALAAVNSENPNLIGCRLWVGTTAGLARVELCQNGSVRETPSLHSIKPHQPLPSGPVQGLAAGPNGDVIVAYAQIPSANFLTEERAKNREQTKIYHVTSDGLTAKQLPVRQDLTGQDPDTQDFGKSTFYGLAYLPKKVGLFIATDAGLFHSRDVEKDSLTLAGGYIPVTEIRTLALAAGSDEGTVWMGSAPKGDSLPSVVGYRPEQHWQYTLKQPHGVPRGPAVDDLDIAESGILVVAVDSKLAAGKVFVPVPLWHDALFYGLFFSIVVGLGVMGALFVWRRIYPPELDEILKKPALLRTSELAKLPATLKQLNQEQRQDVMSRLELKVERVSIMDELALLFTAPSTRRLSIERRHLMKFIELLDLARLLAGADAIKAVEETLLWTEIPTPIRPDDIPSRLMILVGIRHTASPEASHKALGSILHAYQDKPIQVVAICQNGEHVYSVESYLGYVVDEQIMHDLLFSPEPMQRLSVLVTAHRADQDNPYRQAAGVKDPAMFFGRQDELQQLASHVDRSAILVGPRRIGKSSLLTQLYRTLQKQHFAGSYHVVSVDLQAASSMAESSALDQARAQSIIERCADVLASALRAVNLNPDSPEPVRASRFTQFIETAHQNSKKRIIILIDETDVLVKADEVLKFLIFNELRAMCMAGICTIIMAGYRDLYHSSLSVLCPLYNFGETLFLRPLDKTSSMELIRVPMRRLGIKIEPRPLGNHDPEDNEYAVPNRIYNLTGGNPNLIQQICQNLVREAAKSKHLIISSKDVERIERSADIQSEVHRAFRDNTLQMCPEFISIAHEILDREVYQEVEFLAIVKRVLGPERAKQKLEAGLITDMRLLGYLMTTELSDKSVTYSLQPLLLRMILKKNRQYAA